MFARYGVPEYWIIDPVKQTIEVHRLETRSYLLVQRVAGDDKVESAVLPGAALRAGSIFPLRSEERSVGKECRSRWSPYH